MTLTELKARAYDILANIEHLQRLLQVTNEEIGKVAQAEAVKARQEAEQKSAQAQEA